MKKFLLLTFILLLISCEEKINNIECVFQGKLIKVEKGNNSYFLRMIGKDSLFVNTYRKDNSTVDYIYYTKGDIKVLSWKTAGKFSKQITNIQK